MTRLRPVLMTTIATILGPCPWRPRRGGAESRRAIGAVIGAGCRWPSC
ncbi:efflux RND transporter permease subunit [Paracoccus marcusii]|nr:efflux RND transporter permease subunit [Paracoccus marcusii]